ncbi:MFS transporter [Alicyclobacillus mengziensis]|uniref:MFS transporter n=1 Tax=Alicyclobacillus mengziensis TaxID=2931921 RepID=A0A9X7Z7D4_9BACL|nr:MFS transporter [Alicyclobacillus mengziensis]QSO47240.1 MFS transporter [Alicyclobacillus mengziensis]
MKPTNFRWAVITMLFFATTINYLDRTNLSVALPKMAHQFHWGPAAMGAISSAFLLSYGLLQIPVGALIDKLGTRVTYIWSIIVWSLASMATAIANSFGMLYLFRLILGVGEAPAFPAATKTAADWIPRKQRGIATGFFTAGVNMGSAIALPLVAWLVTAFGWKSSFVVTGLLGLVWLIFWLVFYRDRHNNPRVNAEENALIDAGAENTAIEEKKVPYGQLFGRKSTWGLMLGYFCQVYIMYVFITWLPSYLVTARHMSLLKTGMYGMLPFIFGAIFAFVGGVLSDKWVQVNRNGRKYSMVIGLLFGVAVIPAVYASAWQWALVLLTIAESGVMFSNGAAWGACSEIAPRGQAGSVASMQNFGGNVGGYLAPLITGILVQASGNFVSALVLSGILAVLGAILYFSLLPASKTTAMLASTTTVSSHPING